MDGAPVELASWLASPYGVIAAALFGALWGSFFNVCIARVPRGESVVTPGSRCFACGAAVRAFDNVPIFSYFLLRGKCRACGARFSIRYALVEALVALLAALVWWRFVLAAPEVDPSLRLYRFFVHFAFVGVLVVLAFIDLDTKRLPDVITLPSVAVFFLLGFLVDQIGWKDRAIGAAAGYIGVRVIADGYYYLTGREGLGLGDGKLLAVVGALLGWKALPPTIFAASFVGIFVSVPALLMARARRTPGGAPGASTPPDDTAVAIAADASRVSETAGGPEGGPLREPFVVAEDADPEKPGDEELSLRRAEVPFGPFLVLSALGYMFFADPIWAFIYATVAGD